MILCEGYMDVIALHAAGFEYAVATLGTAITPDHARIFSKYTQKVIISYDSDEAGQNAANKAMRILGEVGMDVRVLKLSGAKDPDEFIKKFGSERFRLTLEESRTGFDHKAEQIYSKYDLAQGSDKIKATNEICTLIAEYWSAVEREVYIAQAAKRLQMPTDVLKNSVEILRKRAKRSHEAKQSREAQATLKNFGDRINPDSAKDPRAASAEEIALGLLLIFEEYRNAIEKQEIELSEEDFVTEFNRRVFCAIMRLHQSEGGLHQELLGAEFSPDEMGRIRRMEVARQQLTNNGPEVLRSAVSVIKEAKIKESTQNEDLQTRLARLRKKQENIHKGKADKT
jgi:DNA primase